MKKTIIKLIPTFLTFLLVLNSCGVDSKNNKNTTDINTNLIKSFKTQSLPILKDPDDSIEIVEKDSDVPIKMTIAREYPKNVPVKFKGVGILPISRTPTTIQPIPEQELKKMREAQFKAWSDWFERNYKLIRSSFIKINNQIDKAFEEEFELELKKHSKKSKERENIEKLYEIKEKALHKKEKEALELLEKGYKDTLAKARINIVEIHHDNDDHHFKVNGWGEDLWNGFMSFVVPATEILKNAVIEVLPNITVFGLVNTIINDISKLVNNVVQTPKTDPPPVFNSELSNIGKQTTTFESNPDYSKPLSHPQRQIITKTDSSSPRVVLQSASISDLVNKINQTDSTKIIIPFQFSNLLRGVTNSSSFAGQMVVNTICSKSSSSSGGDLWSCSDSKISDGIGAAWLEEEDLINGKINFKVNFIGEKSNPELWVKTLIEKYRNNFDSASMQIIENNESKLVDLIRNSEVSAKLESPKICNQKITTSFDSGGFVNFQGKLGKGLFYDGEYTFYLSFINKVSREETVIKMQKINILQLLNDSRIFDLNGNLINYQQSSPLEISLLNLYDTRGNLSLSDIDGYKLDSGDIGFYALNNTPNLWDLRIRRVSSESCLNVYYQAHCLDLKSGDLLFKKSFFDTGIYKLETNYSTYPEIKGIDTATLKKESDFMMLNIDYSTFARKSSKAEMMRVNSEIVKDSVSPSISINKFQGINQYYNPIDGVSSDPYDLPPLTIDTIPEPNKIRATSLVNKVLKKGSGLAVEGNNLFIDLAKSHSQANITESNYDAFYGVSLPSCTKNSFVNVGAVIDITNGIYINNKPLYDKNISLPLIMQIVKKDPSNTQYGYVPIKSWSFDAKIGSHTVIQEYWNGSTDQVGNPSTLPDYKSGEYLVKIFLNNDLMPSTLRDISNRFDIHVSKPAIASSSTDAKIIVNEDNNCPDTDGFVIIQNDIEYSANLPDNEIEALFNQADVSNDFLLSKILSGDKSYTDTFKIASNSAVTSHIPYEVGVDDNNPYRYKCFSSELKLNSYGKPTTATLEITPYLKDSNNKIVAQYAPTERTLTFQSTKLELGKAFGGLCPYKWAGRDHNNVILNEFAKPIVGPEFVQSGSYNLFFDVKVKNSDGKLKEKFSTKNIVYDVTNNFSDYSTKYIQNARVPYDIPIESMYHIREAHDVNFINIEQMATIHAFLFGRITEAQMMDILVRTTINDPNSTFKKGVCFNQKISPRNFFSDIQNMANMSSLDDYWKDYKSGNSLTISSLKEKTYTANQKLEVVFTYGGKPNYPLKIATGYPDSDYIVANGAMDLNSVRNYFIDHYKLKSGNKKKISELVNKDFINSMAYINGNGTSYNMGILSNFLKSTFGTKWDSVLNEGIPKLKMPYNLLKSLSNPSNPFEPFNLKDKPNITISNIEKDLQVVTNKL